MEFSVITINYNNFRGLRNTIESVISQTCQDYEYIVIDGGSSDGSVEVIKRFSSRIAFWVSEPDRGIYHAMNKGVAHAKGKYCIFMNSGDCFYGKDVLLELKSKLVADIVIGRVSIDDENHIISPPPCGELTLYHLYAGAVPHQGSFIKTSLLRKHPYDETLRISSDWKFFLQVMIFDNCSVSYVGDFVAKYDMGGISSANPELMLQEKEKILSDMFPPRLLADYKKMKQSECFVQTLTPQLRCHGRIDRFLYRIARLLLKIC